MIKKTSLQLSRPKTSPTSETDPSGLSELRDSVGSAPLVVIANREPYVHERRDGKIQISRPAGGLVSALEPVLRECGGLWLAHGGGSADWEVCDDKGQIQVPPQDPSYLLKRVYLRPEQVQGHYYGFSNEGLWPLCHLAHIRPKFRRDDWHQYQVVNEKFAAQTPDHLLQQESLILVQDYHFAILPKLLRSRSHTLNLGQSRSQPQNGQPQNGQPQNGRPKIGLFWHIPWPNSEIAAICPWIDEVLEGMLGADLIGFHTRHYCENFLDTCERLLGATVDREKLIVEHEGQQTHIRPLPIGISTESVVKLSQNQIDELKARHQISTKYLAIGVDRLDYTKGLVERVEGVERFLEKYPEFVGHFTLVQIGSPSRTRIPAYQTLANQLRESVERIERRFGAPEKNYHPVRLINSHHEWAELQKLYQIADVCMVTSLHDGMNLVAKEYVWCQRPERGALILSKFTGAAAELGGAYQVNPYSTDEIADALAAALRSSPEQRAWRMGQMRHQVEHQNAYHWASELIQSVKQAGEPGQSFSEKPARRPKVAQLRS